MWVVTKDTHKSKRKQTWSDTSRVDFSANTTNSGYRAIRYNIVPSLIFFGQMYSTSCGSVIRISYAKSAVSRDSLLTELFGQATDSPKAAVAA